MDTNTAPALLLPAEKQALYDLVIKLKPRMVCEIGTRHGGSAVLICSAMEANGFGSLSCIDFEPDIAAKTWESIRDKAVLLQGDSSTIMKLMQAKFQLIFVDGDHTCAGVIKDIEAALPLLDDNGYLLFHDSFHAGVRDGIKAMLAKYPALVDRGLIADVESIWPNGDSWSGLQLIQKL